MIDLIKVQEAFIARLLANAAVAAIVGPKVYNHVPQGTEYPYLSFEFASLEPAPPKNGQPAWVASILINTYSQYRGDSENIRLHQAVFDSLNHAVIPLAGGSIDCTQYQRSQFARGGDGVTSLASFTFTTRLNP